MTEKATQEKEPNAPEPQFFDSLKGIGRLQGLFRDLWEKWWGKFIVIGGGMILAILFFWPRSGKKAKEVPVRLEEKRIEATPTMMERDIHASANNVKERPKFQGILPPSKSTRRKLNSSIAVFVAKDERGKKETDSRVRVRREEEFHIGLPAGTKIPALLTTRIFSFNVTAPVTARVAKDFLWQEEVRIPEGSEFLGEADVVKSIDRINVRFERLIFPDGKELRVRGMALSEDGSAGLRGKVEKHTDRRILKALAETAVGTAALLGGGRRGDPYSLEDEARSNLFGNLTSEAQRDIRSERIEKSIDVPAYTALQVILLEQV